MSAAAPTRCCPPWLIQITIICGSNESRSSAAPMKYYPPTCHLQFTIKLGFYLRILSVVPEKYHRLWLLRNNVNRGSNKMPSVAARMNSNHLWLQWNAIGHGSNESRSSMARIKYHRSRLQRDTINCGSNKIPSTTAPTKFLSPSHLQITIERGSYSIMLAAAPINTVSRGSNDLL